MGEQGASKTADFSDLMRRVREGSEEAAWELVHSYGEDIRQAVRRRMTHRLRPIFDSLDFVQVVWKSVFQARDRLDRFQDPHELVKYLVGMARHKVCNELRCRTMTVKHARVREQSLHSPRTRGQLEVRDPRSGPIDAAIARERWNRLLESQPPHYRRILELRAQGNTCESIAETLDMDESTVRRFLKKMFKKPPV
jgi:RNA polymerase sigma factor (sigma-70 family)